MANIDYTQEDRFRGLSARDVARILQQTLSSPDSPGVVLLIKKTDGTYEPVKSDDAGGLQVAITQYLWYPRWSSYQAQVQLTTVAGDKTLPSITMRGLPSGATLALAIILLKFHNVENTNAAVNSVSGAQNIQARKAVGGAWVTGIALGGGEFSTPASTREGGDVMFGTEDISAQIPANGAVIELKWALALAAQNNLEFNNVQAGVGLLCSF